MLWWKQTWRDGDTQTNEQTIIKHGSPGQIKTRPIKTRLGEKQNKTDNSKRVD